jgi:catechol 2,3-dioxygenase-like lactoylglutathione lyase family enzyme
VKGILWVLALAALGSSSQKGSRFERVDHFWWLVRDVQATGAFFRDTLGFTLGPDVLYPFADLRHVWFEDGTFLELVSQPAARPALGEAVSAFLRVHEGAWKMGIFVNDVSEVARDLKARGLRVSEPSGGTWQGLGARKDLPEEMWTGIDLLQSPGHLAYFWHFTPGWDQMRARMPEVDPLGTQFTQHANTALGFRTAWLATWDLERARRDFGFLKAKEGATPFDVPHLQARGEWLDLERGRILLLAPEDDEGPVMEFLFTRGEGVMGASIEVQSLDGAQKLIESRSGRRFPSYAGLEGASLLLPASFTHGVSLELFERPGANDR